MTRTVTGGRSLVLITKAFGKITLVRVCILKGFFSQFLPLSCEVCRLYGVFAVGSSATMVFLVLGLEMYSRTDSHQIFSIFICIIMWVSDRIKLALPCALGPYCH